MYQGFILRRAELRTFEDGLRDHQKALMADGLTTPQRAWIEHNMAAAFKVYEYDVKCESALQISLSPLNLTI